jgi:hypothetical protein
MPGQPSDPAEVVDDALVESLKFGQQFGRSGTPRYEASTIQKTFRCIEAHPFFIFGRRRMRPLSRLDLDSRPFRLGAV